MGAGQGWDYANAQRWTNLAGTKVQVEELQVAGTNLCVNFSPSDFHFYLDSCVKSDWNELFWHKVNSSNGNEWFINVDASEIMLQNYYMTATSAGSYADVVADPAGYGDNAVWDSLIP